MPVRILVLMMSLSLLPQGWGYSITSSLEPTIEYSPNPSTGSSSSRQLRGAGATTVSPAQASAIIMPGPEGASESFGRYSHFIRARDSKDSYRGPYSAPNYEQNQYTPTQFQMAGRILFESRATTPKPYLGYRSIISSYRNPNYFVKPSKQSETSYLVGPSSKTQYPNAGDESDEEDSDRDGATGKAFFGTSAPEQSSRSYEGLLIPVDPTTPESKTLPATDFLPPDSPTDRPSSTQQMRSDETLFSTAFTGSESNNHYQFSSNNQWIQSHIKGKRPIQFTTPEPLPTSSSLKGGPHLPGPNEEQDYDYGSTIPSHHSYGSGDEEQLEEETINFPATTNPSPKPFYKVPVQPGEEIDLSSSRNIIELRNGANGTANLSSKANESKSAIKFPKEVLTPVPEGDSKEPSCANDLGYCDISTFQESYPKELINSVLTNSISSDLFKKIFSDVEVGIKPGTASDSILAGGLVPIAGRNNINPLAQETPLCLSQEVTIYPRAAKNKDDKWMFIVNHDDYIQGVRVEKCVSEGGSCMFGDASPLGYESVCRQKFILRKLVALNGEGKTSLDTFKLPSCCVCFLKNNYILDRKGASDSNVSPSPVRSHKGNSSEGPDEGSGTGSVGNVNDNSTDCPEKTPNIEPASNRNASSLLPDMSHVNLNSTNVNLTQA